MLNLSGQSHVLSLSGQSHVLSLSGRSHVLSKLGMYVRGHSDWSKSLLYIRIDLLVLPPPRLAKLSSSVGGWIVDFSLYLVTVCSDVQGNHVTPTP